VKVGILAGGQGTRLAEETESRPKPMVDIGGRPILWHIMKHFARYGHREFAVALGYKGEMIKRFFVDYMSLEGSMRVSLADGAATAYERDCEDWTVDLIDTGAGTNTGGRVLGLRPWLDGATFMLTYGDGVSNIDLDALVAFHRSHGRLATVSAVRPPSRFGAISFDDSGAVCFTEKPQMGEGWINGGFMVLEPGVFDFLEGDDTSLEGEALERLSAEGQLMAYRHDDFWQCVDTMRDLRFLRSLMETSKAPWVTW